LQSVFEARDDGKKMGMGRRIVLLVVLLLVTAWVGLFINEARRLRDHVLADPRAKQTVTFKDKAQNTVTMTFGEFALHEAAKKQTNFVNYRLLNTPSAILWSAIYATAGLSGGFIYLLLLVVAPGAVVGQGDRIEVTFQGSILLARLCVSAVAGALSFLVVILPAQAAILSIKLPKMNVNTSEADVYGNMLLFPSAAGIFVSTFYERLKDWLNKLMLSKNVSAAKK
jgi:hypothetical protein